ncbi:hypothetical protein PHISCL_10630 [Aspergillus sclerotialis]|uniref:UBC core domain-containing protein n=1 Tax=Aspergillus sclerotialis TaxID=2070753 RepID=A0A3A2Z4B8_9EURO|nr:hypothetical protein PHISCL_10630 [Aspergillus sclerotialis]
MSTSARRRLMRDFKRMQTDPPAGVSASPIADNVMTWNAVIIGPADTPFEDGTFRLVMQFEEAIQISHRGSNSSHRCSIQTCMALASCAWISCRTGGLQHTTLLQS